jgi:hypothetical protein
MNLRFLTTALLAACVGATAFGQALDRAIVASTAPLTEAQKTALGTFLAKHIEAVKSGTDAAATDESRMAVVAMLRDPAATTQFRRAVATAFVADLGPVVKGSDSRRAIVAMQLLRFTRAQEALDVVLERTSPAAERRPVHRDRRRRPHAVVDAPGAMPDAPPRRRRCRAPPRRGVDAVA